MKVSGSILSIKDNNSKIVELMNSGIDLLHLDIMDGKFVDNYSLPYQECSRIISTIPLDIHLMVENPYEYIKEFITLKPKYISFHIETNNIMENINFIKNNNILVGLAISPETNIDTLLPYLDKIDLVLLMSVTPGYGGQEFINSTYERINQIKNYREQNNLNFEIEVDGGINVDNIKFINSDIIVIGSAITKTNDYKKEVERIGEML